MSFAKVIRRCLDCDADLPDDAVPIEEGIWWIEAEGRLVCNPKLAAGPFGTDFANFLQDCGLPAIVICNAVEVVAVRRLKIVFPHCRVKLFAQCSELGFPIIEEKGGAA